MKKREQAAWVATSLGVAFFLLVAFALVPTAAQANPEKEALKTDEVLSHANYRAAKRMCVVVLHLTKEKHQLPPLEVNTLLHLCSQGDFEKALFELNGDIEHAEAVHRSHDGAELVDQWEVHVRDTHAQSAFQSDEGEGSAQ